MPFTGFLYEMSKNKTQIFREISKPSNFFRIKDETHLRGEAEDLLHQLLSL